MKQQVSKLFGVKRKRDMRSNPRALYLRNHIKKLREPLEVATHTGKHLPFARNITDMKTNLGARTKLLDWFAFRHKILSKHVVKRTYPQLLNKSHTLKQDNIRLAKQNEKLKSVISLNQKGNPPIVRKLRLFGCNTGK